MELGSSRSAVAGSIASPSECAAEEVRFTESELGESVA
jgi:hypothetical protein